MNDRPYFQTPLNPQSQIVSVSTEGLVFVLLYLHNGNTKLSDRTQKVQTSVLKLMYLKLITVIACVSILI